VTSRLLVQRSSTECGVSECDLETSTMRSRPIGGCRAVKNRITIMTDMRRFTTGIRSEKSVVRRFRRCANVFLHKPR
jgi:hypothetical protein